VRQGLLRAAAGELFAGFCRRLAYAGVPLWRGFAAMRTLHPQWGGYGYSWQREEDAIELQQFGRTDGPAWLRSPFAFLLHQANTRIGAQEPWLHLRRHLTGPDAQLDFPLLEELAAEGGSDYFA
jgi:adenylate cyclase